MSHDLDYNATFTDDALRDDPVLAHEQYNTERLLWFGKPELKSALRHELGVFVTLRWLLPLIAVAAALLFGPVASPDNPITLGASISVIIAVILFALFNGFAGDFRKQIRRTRYAVTNAGVRLLWMDYHRSDDPRAVLEAHAEAGASFTLKHFPDGTSCVLIDRRAQMTKEEVDAYPPTRGACRAKIKISGIRESAPLVAALKQAGLVEELSLDHRG